MERITIEHGLSQGMIFDMVQTRDGFLWIGTKDGLNRYDGYNFRVHINDPFDPFTLTENTITALYEDSRGWLWVGLESEGLSIYDPKTGLFHHVSLNFGLDTKGRSFDVMQFFEAPDKSMYILQNGNGLLRVRIPDAWAGQLPRKATLTDEVDITRFPFTQFRGLGEEAEPVLTGISLQQNGAIWVYTSRCAYLVDAEKGFVRPVPNDLPPDDRQWIWGTSPQKLVCFWGKEIRPVQFAPGVHIGRMATEPTPEGGFWVSIDQALWYLEPGEALDLNQPDWVADARITAIVRDRNGNIWVGTQGYGLRKINPRKQLFHSDAKNTSVWGLWRDLDGRYFCKIVNQVYPYDPVTGEIGTQPSFPEGPQRVLDVCFDPSGAYWLLGRAEAEEGITEIRYLDPRTRQSKSYPFPNVPSASGKQRAFKLYVYARLLRSTSGLLMATGTNCLLAQLNPKTGQIRYFDYSHLFKEKWETIRAMALVEGGNGVLWIGTQQGLVKCVPQPDGYAFELMQASPDNQTGLNSNSIACILPDPEDPAHTLWIGTKGGGINRLDIDSGLVDHVTTKNNLPDNVVYGILPGSRGELWCSTNRGLARIRYNASKEIEGITAFTATQGLQDNEFNTQAFFKASNGELLFGGVNGLNHFFPEEVLPDTTAIPLFLVGIRVNQEPVVFGQPDSPLSAPLDFLHEIKLNYDQNNVSFEFAVLDFTDPAKNRYRYQLVGVDEDWVETGTYRFAHFTHLAPGRYTLRAEGSNGEGDWQPLGRPIVIIVRPPWWRSNVALLLYTLLLMWLARKAYLFQLRRVKMREQLAFEHRETQRLKALEEMKSNFFNNITHEFRTPLSLILEPARRIRAKTEDAEVMGNAQRIETNSLRLLEMVNQLLDLAKIESGSMPVDVRRGDLSDMVRGVFHSFLPLAEQRGIRLSLAIMDDIQHFSFDHKKTELIVNNLISNALKFTPPDGFVQVILRRSAEDGGADIRVGDSGSGIPLAEQARIFERFYQVAGTASKGVQGSGIGLALSKELAELLGGSLRVKSEPGKGSVFTLHLPALEAQVVRTDATEDAENIQELPARALNLLEGQDKPMVLLVEDNAELRQFVKQCIADQWQVVEASNGEEGIEKARALIPDLIISDVMMPYKDGYEVCDALKNDELTSHVPIIMLTAKSNVESRIKGLRTGADDYLTKPFSTEELLVRMENLVSSRRHLRMKFSVVADADGGLAPVSENIPAESVSALDREFIQRFVDLVEQNLSDENISVEDFAKKMHISRVQLHRKLKALTGENVTDFIRDYRLDRAMTMLRKGEGLIYEVAYQVGFGSEKYFSRAFKKKFGVSPSQITYSSPSQDS